MKVKSKKILNKSRPPKRLSITQIVKALRDKDMIQKLEDRHIRVIFNTDMVPMNLEDHPAYGM